MFTAIIILSVFMGASIFIHVIVVRDIVTLTKSNKILAAQCLMLTKVSVSLSESWRRMAEEKGMVVKDPIVEKLKETLQ